MDETLSDLDGQILVALDVETTGLSAAYGDRVCEVGIVRVLGGEIFDTFQSLVNPHRPISPGASRVNGLSDEDVCDAPDFSEITPQLLERIDGAFLICHNAAFDLGFMDAEIARLGRSWQPAGVIDTLAIARTHFRFPSNSLASIASLLDIETPQAHRALGDALTTQQVFHHFYKRLAGQGDLPFLNLVEPHQPRLHSVDESQLPVQIQEALASGNLLVITYVDGQGQKTERLVKPIHVQADNDYIYLVAYCHLRQAQRTFRLDRITAYGGAE
jgi:DNA polymerase-3 subunit epsilon